jgi:hypothetical protein
MSAVVKIENLNRILSALKKTGLDAQDLKGATKKASALVLPIAIARTPVRKQKLQRTVKASTAKNIVAIKAGTPKSVPYGAVIHWGWKKRNIEPNPWLLKIRDEYSNDVKNIYTEEIQRLIDQTMDGIK